jgi:hypothetical protein
VKTICVSLYSTVYDPKSCPLRQRWFDQINFFAVFHDFTRGTVDLCLPFVKNVKNHVPYIQMIKSFQLTCSYSSSLDIFPCRCSDSVARIDPIQRCPYNDPSLKGIVYQNGVTRIGPQLLYCIPLSNVC